jgi:DNA-directed RNA polymerase subunit RPC12/RpoP
MTEEKLKCLRCGNEYSVRAEPKEAPRERVCPQCKSNSVRKITPQKDSR